MRVAMVSSECEPFAKTGGLADVVDALARALGRSGGPGATGEARLDVDVYLPWYRGLVPPADLQPLALRVPTGRPPSDADDGQARTSVTLWTAHADGYRLRLVEHGPSFDRESYYVDSGGDYADNAARFTLLGRAALEAIRAEARPVDVLHGHDWEAGPALLSLRHRYGGDPLLAPTATVLTCHNLAFHGWTSRERAWQLDLPDAIGARDGVDPLREAVRTADIVNTVSPTYARESLTHEYGGGLDDVLRERGDRYVGILNGIDTELWNPATDAVLTAGYSASDTSGKAACKADLCARHGLDPDGPLLGVIGRLDPQKGFDLVTEAAPELLRMGARLIVLGTGDRRLIEGLKTLVGSHAGRLVIVDRFDRVEARRIYAGGDLFLMPSRFEPCGQGQLIALRYGTLPVVRSTGGLADTVRDADADLADGTGFMFAPADATGLLDACRRAMAALADAPRFVRIQQRAMARDVSWAEPARQYAAVYERAIALRRRDRR